MGKHVTTQRIIPWHSQTSILPSITTAAAPAAFSSSPSISSDISPPLGEHCLASILFLPPVLSLQKGARTVCADPVTGSSGMPTQGAK